VRFVPGDRCDQRPFAPLPERPEHHVRLHRIVAPIRNEEACVYLKFKPGHSGDGVRPGSGTM
jgi:hypothetical protein